MLIDWFTVVAQIINFFILVLALKFLLYDRVVDAMERRRQAIAEREREVEERLEAAGRELAALRQQRHELEKLRDEMLEEARREAGERRRQLLHQARSEVEQQAEEWRESLRSQRQRLLLDLQRFTAEKVIDVSHRLLADMAGRSLEESLISGFVDRIEAISEEERASFADVVQTSEGPIVVRTGMEVSNTQREAVEKALRDLAGDAGRSILWHREEELISGIVVQLGARTLGWSVAGYLEDLEREFADLVAQESLAEGSG